LCSFSSEIVMGSVFLLEWGCGAEGGWRNRKDF
jgi:hypothetical protein